LVETDWLPPDGAVVGDKRIKPGFSDAEYVQLFVMLLATGYSDFKAVLDVMSRPFGRLDGIFQAALTPQGHLMPACRHPEARKRPT